MPDLFEHASANPLLPDAVPQQIGNYRIIRRIGAGGMGAVFEAEQADPRRRVALKILRDRLAFTDEGVRLFKREAQALARLRHPAIATIYEAGNTPEGVWYLAMELVPGSSLSAWLEARPVEHGLSREALAHRLWLFRQVCGGIAYAHQKGVIHRDIKPSNMIVRSEDPEHRGGDSDIKILDFGLALVQDETASLATMSEPGIVRGTIAYMSPEQALGLTDDLDARTDVYALGVMLYEMITGRLPHDLSGITPVVALARVSNAPPVSPSRIWRGQGMQLDPDLETIILKALAKEPDDRYQTVAALADDVDRFVSGYPILARSPSVLYQGRKWVRRHRAATAVAAGVVAVIVGSAIVATIQRNHARVEAAKSASVVDFLVRMLSAADPTRGSRDVTVAEVLGQAAREADVALAGVPQVSVVVRNVLGQTYRSLGKFAEADSQFRVALATASRPGGGGSVAALDVWENIGELRFREGKSVEADSVVRSVLRQREAELAPDDILVARALNLLGAIAITSRHVDRADTLFSRALAIRLAKLGPDELPVAEVRDNLATVRYDQGQFAAAESLFSGSLAIRRLKLRPDHPDIAVSAGNLAMTLKEQRKFDVAEPLYHEALAVSRRAFGEIHPEVARNTNNIGMFYYAQKKYDEADRWLKDGVSLNERIFGRRNLEVATGLNNLGLVARDQGRYKDAIAYMSEAADIEHQLKRDVIYGQYLRALAFVYVRNGQPREAEATYRKSIAIHEQTPGTPSWEVPTTTNLLGDLLAGAGRFQEAERAFQFSFPAIRRQFGDASPRTKVARDRYVGMYRRWGKPALADSIRLLDSTLAKRP